MCGEVSAGVVFSLAELSSRELFMSASSSLQESSSGERGPASLSETNERGVPVSELSCGDSFLIADFMLSVLGIRRSAETYTSPERLEEELRLSSDNSQP